MARYRTIRRIIAAAPMLGIVIAVAASTGAFGASPMGNDRIAVSDTDGSAALTADQQALVDFALTRFESHDLVLPNVKVQWYESLQVCGGHKGLYEPKTLRLHMCSMDEATMLHELAHAWARHNLSAARQAEFTHWRGLDTWNDQDHAWKERATEHVAETITWALLEEPSHVRWVEESTDGSTVITHRILTLDVDVETLVENFVWLTGQHPKFRLPTEWDVGADSASALSPERWR